MVTRDIRYGAAIGLALAGLSSPAGAAQATETARPAAARAATRDYDIAAQDLGPALRAAARQAGLELIVRADLVEGKRAPALRGHYAAGNAVAALLAGSGLVAEFRGGTVIVHAAAGSGTTTDTDARGAEPARRETDSHEPGSRESDSGETEIVVTGSRLRGTAPAAPVITLSQDDARTAGQASLAEIARSLPQNFGGGQNPGLGFNVPAGSGGDSSGASSLNLRGLGSDATLTLLNGRRLAYNAQRQSVDISAIPLLAVDRIEIVADGASAIYGSDAVAGVANVILKHDHDGLMATARVGASTDGGNVSQQYGALGGRTWAGGGVFAAYEYASNSAVIARQRDYTSMVSPGATLFPRLARHNLLVSGHQALTETLGFGIDALYNRRTWRHPFSIDARGDYRLAGGNRLADSEAFTVAPSLTLALPAGWRTTLAATYGRDEADFRTEQWAEGTLAYLTALCYCNTATSLELAADGPLFALPGGAAQLAIGGGYRRNRLVVEGGDVRAHQISRYAFAELSLPLVAPAQAVPFIHRLQVTGAVRAEDYRGRDTVTTPKLGLVWAPTSDLTFRLSWGRSFKVPTLYQQYNQPTVALYTAASRGAVGVPATASALQILLGNPDLDPERAETLSAGVVIEPRFLDGARLEITYFDIDYRDRIVTPIPYTNRALSDPAYASFVNGSPSDADKAAAIALGEFFNVTGRPYDPANVVAIIDNRYRNAARQSVHGIDVAASYTADLGSSDTLRLTASGSWLDSRQRLSALQPVTDLSGTLFNPPALRARGGAAWTRGTTTLAGFVNYTGGVDDMRTSPGARVGAMTTLDLVARHVIGQGAVFGGLDVSLSVHNAFNAKPDSIAVYSVYDLPYDSTNYSPLGRTVSLNLTKAW